MYAPSPFPPSVSPLAAMQAAGLTVADLCRTTGKSRTCIQNALMARERQLRGERVARHEIPNPHTGARIARAIGEQYDYSIFYLAPPKRHSPGENVPRFSDMANAASGAGVPAR